jgi:hypothetical protein
MFLEQIVFEETSGELVGADVFSQLPKFTLPQPPDFLRPPAGLRYVDSSQRIGGGQPYTAVACPYTTET